MYLAHIMKTNHDDLDRDMARLTYGHSPDPFYWPRYYHKGYTSDGYAFTSKELPKVEPDSLDDLEVLGELLLEAVETAQTEDEFDAIINNITEF